jgi:membrane-bound serine protease (ClpP class)
LDGICFTQRALGEDYKSITLDFGILVIRCTSIWRIPLKKDTLMYNQIDELLPFSAPGEPGMSVDFLLDPNVAYLIFVGASLLTMMAVLNPGTGVLEIIALFLWLISAYIIFNIPINFWALGLMFVGGILFLLSLRRIKNLVYLGLSIAAVIVGSIFLFDQPGWQPAVNPVLAVIVSLVVAGFVWVVAQKALEAESMRPAHDLDALVGRLGEAKTAINDEGSVQVAGELWSAKSEQSIPEGTHVRIVGRDGFILVVEQNEETSE